MHKDELFSSLSSENFRPMIISIVKCVVTDYVEKDLDWEAIEYKRVGVDFEINQLRLAPPSELIKTGKDADVIVVDQARITAEVMAGWNCCRLVIRHGDGFDNLDLAAATENGIVCANEPGFWSREVAEQAFIMGCALALRLPIQQKVAAEPRGGKNPVWDLKQIMPYRSLANLTVGIIGCGRIGSISAGLFSSIAKRLLICDPYILKAKAVEFGEYVDLNTLLSEADIVSLHIPANRDTLALLNTERIIKMKKGSILVNTSRGSVVDTDALVDALKSGHLGGAALDTTSPEPLEGGHPLFKLPNVMITPHMGWYSEDALWSIRRQILADALAALKGKAPLSILNPDVMKQDNCRLNNKHQVEL